MRKWLIFLRLLRVKQWTKNAIVFAAFIFALGDPAQHLDAGELWKVALAALAFALVSSAVYIFNDWRDLELDRLHPVKRNRPLASGVIQPGPALRLAVVLLALGLGIAWRLSMPLLMVLGGYLLLQVAYSLKLKHIPLVDVMVISLGFVLRTLCLLYTSRCV